MSKTKSCFYQLRLSDETAKNTCLLLLACSLLLMISLPGQADHEPSGWPFPVPETAAIGKLTSVLGGYYISAAQVVAVFNANAVKIRKNGI